MYISKLVFVLVVVLAIMGITNVGLACWEVKCNHKDHTIYVDEYDTKNEAKEAKAQHDKKEHNSQDVAYIRPCY